MIKILQKLAYRQRSISVLAQPTTSIGPLLVTKWSNRGNNGQSWSPWKTSAASIQRISNNRGITTAFPKIQHIIPKPKDNLNKRVPYTINFSYHLGLSTEVHENVKVNNKVPIIIRAFFFYFAPYFNVKLDLPPILVTIHAGESQTIMWKWEAMSNFINVILWFNPLFLCNSLNFSRLQGQSLMIKVIEGGVKSSFGFGIKNTG